MRACHVLLIRKIIINARAAFDMRLPPTVNLVAFKQQFDAWTSEEVLKSRHDNGISNNAIIITSGRRC